MPFTGVEWGERFTGRIAGLDGYVFEARIARAGYTGASAEVRLQGGRRRCALEGSAVGAAASLAPLMIGTAELVVFDPTRGAVASLAGAADGEVRLEIVRDPDGEPEQVFLGYLLPGAVYEVPYAPQGTVSLTFANGLGILREHKHSRFRSTVVGHLIDILWPLGGGTIGNPAVLPAGSWGGLTVATDWRPFLGADELTEAQDPLWHLVVPPGSFVDDDGEGADKLTILRQLAARFQARLVESDGRWWLLQRDALARDPTAVSTWPYPASTSGMPARVVADLTRDVGAKSTGGAWRVLGESPARGRTVPVRRVESAYAFEPLPFNLVANGSFEEPGEADGTPSAVATEARWWTHNRDSPFAAARRVDLTDGTEGTGMDPAVGDAFAFRLHGHGPTEPVYSVQQEGFVYLPPSPDWRLRFSLVAHIDVNVVFPDDAQFGGVLLRLLDAAGDPAFAVVEADVTVRASAEPGKEARIYVDRVLDGAAGAVDGAVLVPEGGTLYVYRTAAGPGSEGWFGEVVLARPLRVGDNIVEGDLSITGTDTEGSEDDYWEVVAGDTVRFWYWAPGEPGDHMRGRLSDALSSTRFGASRAVTTLIEVGGYALDGSLVEGYASLDVRGADYENDGEADDVLTYVDDVRWIAEGSDAGRVVRASEMAAGSPGVEVTLPVGADAHPLGDGPFPEATTAFTIFDGSFDDEVLTQRGSGSFTNWTPGVHAAPPGEAVTIDDLSAARALAQVGGVVETFEGVLRPTAGGVLRPHEVLRVEQATTLAGGAAADAGYVLLWARPTVGLPLVLSPGAPAEEVVTVVGVASADDELGAGSGAWRAHVSPPPANAHADGGAAIYALWAWPDVFEHDLGAGTYAVAATRLPYGPEPCFAPAAPALALGEHGAGSAELTWTEPFGADRYRVYTAPTAGGPWTLHETVEAGAYAPPHVVTGLTPPVYLAVRAENDCQDVGGGEPGGPADLAELVVHRADAALTRALARPGGAVTVPGMDDETTVADAVYYPGLDTDAAGRYVYGMLCDGSVDAELCRWDMEAADVPASRTVLRAFDSGATFGEYWPWGGAYGGGLDEARSRWYTLGQDAEGELDYWYGVATVDLGTGAIAQLTELPDYGDCLAYDADADEVWVSDRSGGGTRLQVIDPATGAVTATATITGLYARTFCLSPTHVYLAEQGTDRPDDPGRLVRVPRDDLSAPAVEAVYETSAPVSPGFGTPGPWLPRWLAADARLVFWDHADPGGGLVTRLVECGPTGADPEVVWESASDAFVGQEGGITRGRPTVP